MIVHGALRVLDINIAINYEQSAMNLKKISTFAPHHIPYHK
jgi:hypothetical protein